MSYKIEFITSHPDAIMPVRASEGSAAHDLFSAAVVIEGDKLVVNTGLRTSFPRGLGLFVYSRSGYASKYNLSLINGVGVIDSDYRGDIKLVFNRNALNCSTADAVFHLRPGQRVAQAILMPLPEVRWVHVNSLDATERGEGGFGSTGSS